MMQLQALEPGRTFEYAGREWILLDRYEDRHLCITARPETARQYDKGLHCRFDQAAVNTWLNGEYYQRLLASGGKEIDFNSLLMNLSISMTEGDCVRATHVGLLSWHQRIRYDALIPHVWRWEWSCTISDGIYGHGLRCIAGKPQKFAYYPPNHPEPMLRPALSLSGWAEIN
ncbi:MAG: hypothetical protein IJI14_12125 [Anaerolineaceae bacterium]|nr:hypothetical protein [Anaerolineaceae bacterium]